MRKTQGKAGCLRHIEALTGKILDSKRREPGQPFQRIVDVVQRPDRRQSHRQAVDADGLAVAARPHLAVVEGRKRLLQAAAQRGDGANAKDAGCHVITSPAA
ncbi:hypothetical protein E3D03_012560 [Paracoccus sp. DMF]|nr:hypothetical protein [Paracoccus sp. DMF]